MPSPRLHRGQTPLCIQKVNLSTKLIVCTYVQVENSRKKWTYRLSYACQFIVDILILHIHFFQNPQPPEDIYPGSDGQTLWVSTLSVCVSLD